MNRSPLDRFDQCNGFIHGPAEMPSTVKVGAIDFKIVQWSPEHADGRKCFGETDVATFEIRVAPHSASRAALATTLIHEIMHAICTVWHRPAKAKEEKTVSLLSYGFAAVMRDNPALVAFLLDALR